MGKAIAEHGTPQHLRSNNGPEFITREVRRGLAQRQIKTIYIEPASPCRMSPSRASTVASRDECLNREHLWTLAAARVVNEDFLCGGGEKWDT